MSPRAREHELSMRERQIMDALYALGRATVGEVRDRIPDPPTANAVRTMLGTLTSKGFCKRAYEGRAAVYRPTSSRESAGRRAMRRVLDMFCGGSLASAIAMHLSDPRTRLSEDEAREIRRLIDERKGDR